MPCFTRTQGQDPALQKAVEARVPVIKLKIRVPGDTLDTSCFAMPPFKSS